MGAPCQLVETEPGVYLVLWPHEQIAFVFEQVRTRGGTLTAEVSIENLGLGVAPYRTQLTLQSAAGRLQAAKDRDRAVPQGCAWWEQRLSSSCWLVVDRERKGEPAHELQDRPTPARRWLVDRWIPLGLPTVIYGDGGSGKSMLALALAVCARTGQALGGDPNWRVTPVSSVLVLDWESDREDHEQRIKLLAAGLGQPFPRGIFHRTMRGSLASQVGPIATEVARARIELVLVDSIAPACAAELEASETAIAFMEAVRRLGVTALCVGHVNKAQARDGDGRAQIFGSVQFRNQTRSSFQVFAEEPGDSHVVPVTFRLDKRNLVPPPYPPPAGWAFSYGHDAIRISPAPPSESTLGLTARLLEALQELGQATPADLAERSATPVNAVRALLSRLSKRNSLRNRPQQVGQRGKETLWALTDSERNTAWPSPATPREPDEPPF